MKTDTHFWSHLAHFVVEREIFQIKLQNKPTHTFYVWNNFFLSKIFPLMRCGKISYSGAGHK
jgi:hypothetical protein